MEMLANSYSMFNHIDQGLRKAFFMIKKKENLLKKKKSLRVKKSLCQMETESGPSVLKMMCHSSLPLFPVVSLPHNPFTVRKHISVSFS